MNKRLTIKENDPAQLKSKDKFSFPFNGGEENIDNWLSQVSEYKYFIHDIYFALPEIPNFFSNRMDDDYSSNCIKLLDAMKDSDLNMRSVITINGDYRNYTLSQKDELIDIAIKYIDKYNIYGCVVSDFDIAVKLYEKRPDVVLNTSCNVNHYHIPSLQLWKDKAGVNIINPNRPMARNIPILKELHKTGFKIKLLINERCTNMCPNYLCSVSCTKDSECVAVKYGITPLQSCVVLPRWLNKLDKFVDIYKLTGRMRPLDITLNQLELYILRTDDCMYNELHPGTKVPILCKEIPDELLYCDNNCSKCNRCIDLMKKFATRYINSLPQVLKV